MEIDGSRWCYVQLFVSMDAVLSDMWIGRVYDTIEPSHQQQGDKISCGKQHMLLSGVGALSRNCNPVLIVAFLMFHIIPWLEWNEERSLMIVFLWYKFWLAIEGYGKSSWSCYCEQEQSRRYEDCCLLRHAMESDTGSRVCLWCMLVQWRWDCYG